MVIIEPNKKGLPDPLNGMTLEHVRSRNNPDRGSGNKPVNFFCCWKCNQERNDAEMKKLDINYLRIKSAHGKVSVY